MELAHRGLLDAVLLRAWTAKWRYPQVLSQGLRAVYYLFAGSSKELHIRPAESSLEGSLHLATRSWCSQLIMSSLPTQPCLWYSSWKTYG